MSIFDSIGRGFGFTVGKSVANAMLSTSKQTVRSSNELDDWSHRGYSEGDVAFAISRDFKRDEINWFLFPLALVVCAVPFIGLILTSIFLYKIVLKKHQIYWYNFAWKTYKVSDKRTKEGTREVKVLAQILDRVDTFPTPMKNKIQMIISFVIALSTTLFVWFK